MSKLEGLKFDTGKLQWSLLPFGPMRFVIQVLMYGAKKYSPDNWKKVEPTGRYKDAAMRHLVSYLQGERLDEESGLPHLAHLVCCALFLMWFDHFSPPLNKEPIMAKPGKPMPVKGGKGGKKC